jgi:hypothetical protein
MFIMKSLVRLNTLLIHFIIITLFGSSVYAQNEAVPAVSSRPKQKIQKYEKLIPDTAISSKGVFTTHMVGNKLYYEIPEDQLGKEFIWVTQFSKVQTSYGYGGTEVIRRVVRWERIQDHIILRNVEYDLRALEGTPENIAVAASSVEEIIKSFFIESYGKDKAPVIEVTGLFKDDTHEISPKEDLDVSSIDKARTFITSVKSFEKNIEIRVLATYKKKAPKPSTPGTSRPSTRVSDPSLGAITVELHHSMIKLPDDPMQPRLYDARVGYFDERYKDFSSEEHYVEEIRYIIRWRLEKKNPDQEISEPIKPIVYHIGRGIPEKWHRYIIEGIELWQPAFEAAGFKNAIIGKLAPTIEEDPDFDAEDLRYSTIRWLPSTIENAYGPHINDPRTGEIIESDIRIYHNVIKLLRDWYFTQASPSDPRAQKLPLPDDLMGDLVRYVVAHEVGHTIGLRHNFIATNSYPVESYRDPEFTNKYGTEASIMDYGRFNYIAQPGDNARNIPLIAPYDNFAIEWGYREFDRSHSPEEDLPFLNKIAERQLDDPMLRFGGGREFGSVGSGDPRARGEDLGDDPILATTYGLKNIEYIMSYLVEATGEKDKDYSQLKIMYSEVLDQMFRELNHVAALVGGIEIENYVYGQSPEVFKPTSRAKQKAAVQFLIKNGFHTPDYVIREDIVTRIGMHGVTDKISSNQSQILFSILNSNTANRMIDLDASGLENYSLVELFNDLQDGIFSELNSSDPDIDIFRRNLQRAYVERLITFITPKSATGNDMQAISRGKLVELEKSLQKQIKKKRNNAEHYHFLDLKEIIRIALSGE